MKATVNRKELIKALKYMKELSKLAPDIWKEYRDVLALHAQDNALSLMGGPKMALACVTIEAAVAGFEQGTLSVSYKLLDFIKACRDEYITLSGEKTLSISGESGFKARLANNSTVEIAVRIIQERMNQPLTSATAFRTEDVVALVGISKVLDSQGPRWVSLVQGEDLTYNGMVQATSEEALENYTLVGIGNLVDCVVATDLLDAMLTGRGEHISIGRVEGITAYRLDDPNNPNWWGMLTAYQGSSNA